MQRSLLVTKLRERRAQIMLPAVMLAPIFVLVIYLLFETAKISNFKVRNQFALDNAAYSQLSSTSTYLHAMGMINGPLPYRYMLAFNDIPLVSDGKSGVKPKSSVYELFYTAGAFPAPSKSSKHDEESTKNYRPSPESVDWKFGYYDGNDKLVEREKEFIRGPKWDKEKPESFPAASDKTKGLPIMSQYYAENYFVDAQDLLYKAIVPYLMAYATLGDTFQAQDYVYKQVIKNMAMFRESYWLNVPSKYCKKGDCARESASTLKPYLSLQAETMTLENISFYYSSAYKDGNTPVLVGASDPFPMNMKEVINEPLFQFAYLTSSSLNKLRRLQRGVLLKQRYKLPRNQFNINLEEKYKPYVRTKVTLSCPRNGNNCVWPNPLPKYNVTLDP